MLIRIAFWSMVVLGVFALSGCGVFSATSLRCGTEDGSSYVELLNLPQDLSGQVRNYANLCGFVYESEEVRDET